MALRHGLPAPGADALGHFGEAGGHVIKRMPIGAARFEQQDGDLSVLAQSVGHHTAGRTRADDDVIYRHRLRFLHRRGSDRPPSAAMMLPVAKANCPEARPGTLAPTSAGWPQPRAGTRPPAIR